MKVQRIFFILLLTIFTFVFFYSPAHSSLRQDQVIITIDREGEGNVILNGEEITEFPYDAALIAGEIANLVAVPDPGWGFVSWKKYNLDGTSEEFATEEIELAVEEIVRFDCRFHEVDVPFPAHSPNPDDGARDIAPEGFFEWIYSHIEGFVEPIAYRFRIWTGGRDGEPGSYFEAITPITSFNWIDILNDPDWNTVPYWKTFEWQVVPTTDPSSPDADAIFCPIWTFTTIAAFPPEGMEINLNGVSLFVSHNGTGILPFNPEPELPPFPPDPTLTQAFAFSVTSSGLLDITINTDVMYGWYYQNGIWNGPILNTGNSLLYQIDFNRSGAILYGGNDTTLPVELTSFTATLTTDRYVQLQWISETETNLLGYHVYRNLEDNITEAVVITPTIITATNSSVTTVYTFIDEDIQFGQTYYYWLEYLQIDLTHGFFGPVSAKLSEDTIEPSELFLAKLIINYPNPFNPNTMIKYRIEENTPSVTLKIYNIRGEEVRTLISEPHLKGDHTAFWDGLDDQGRELSSGIYFCRLTTPSTIRVHKMMLLK